MHYDDDYEFRDHFSGDRQPTGSRQVFQPQWEIGVRQRELGMSEIPPATEPLQGLQHFLNLDPGPNIERKDPIVEVVGNQAAMMQEHL